MPLFVPEAEPPLTRAPTGVPPPNPLRPGTGDAIEAAFRQENTVVSLARRLFEESYPPEPGYNPLDSIRGSPYEQRHLDRFIGSRSVLETNSIIRRIEEEDADRKTLDASGFMGTVAQIGAGIIDPTVALPAGTLYRGARGGYSLGRSAVSVGLAGGAGAAVAEGVLQATHETRTLSESMASIASATVLSGIIGGGAASLLSRAEGRALALAVDRERAAIDAHAGNVSERLVLAATRVDGKTYTGPNHVVTMEAAAKDNGLRTDQVVMRDDKGQLITIDGKVIDPATNPTIIDDGFVTSTGRFVDRRESLAIAKQADQLHPDAGGHGPEHFGLDTDDLAPIPGNTWSGRFSDDGSTSLPASAGAAAADTRVLELERSGLGWTSIISTTRRVLSSGSTAARRAMADLAETPYRFTEAAEGVAATQGPALDRLARMAITGTRVEVSDGLTRLFGEYRFGDAETTAPRLRAGFEDFTGAAPDRMSYGEFKQEVSRALRENDQHTVPQVAQAAQMIRSKVFEPWKERAIAAGLLRDGIEVKTADSYFQRVYNKEAIRANRPFFVNKVVDWLKADQTTKAAAKERLTALNDELQGFEAAIAKANNEESAAALMLRRDGVRTKIEEEIAAWEGKSVSEAKAALKAREKYAADAAREADAPRLASADSAIDRAVKRIIDSDRELDDETLRARSHEITERILGSPDGRLPYDIAMGGPEIGWRGAGGEPARGPLAAREFNIPDATIREFLEDDVETVVAMHLRTIVPDVLLTERFGDVRMTEAFVKVEEDYARLTDAARTEKERTRLGNERDAVIRDLAAVRDRIRHVYGWSPELRNMARVAAGAKAVNNLTSMGVAAISSLPDFAGAVFRWGLTGALRDGWAPFFGHLTGQNEGWAKFKTQMRAVGIGIETATNARQHALDDVTDVYRPGSRFERGLQAVSDKFFVANLLAPLTDVQKTIAAHVSVSEILRASKAASEGKATKAQITNLAESGIDTQMAGRLWQQFQTGGEVIDGVHLPNTGDWKDRAAADALNGAVAREVDIAVVTPGQEKPLWMSHPVISVIGQFKAFTAASTERVLVANLMRRDAHALNGLVMAVGLGMLSYKLNSFFGGQETSKQPQDWIKEGVSRGGVLGWFEEGNALASKMTRGGVDVYRMIGADKPLSRFASRSTLDMLLGPTAAKIEGLARVTGAAGAKLRTATSGGTREADWTEGDTRALRRLMALQNLFYVRGLFNQVEQGFNSNLGIEHREPRMPPR